MSEDPYLSDILQKIPRILDDAATEFGLEDRSDVEALGAALVRAYEEGRQAGEAEVMAQAVEQGANITVHKKPRPAP